MELPTPHDLRERRKELDLTQSTLAEMAGVSQPLIARIEGGDVDPRLSTLRRIVNALDEAEGSVVRADDLMNTNVVSVSPDDSVRDARDRMLDEGFSQLPVIRDGRPVGIISNGDIRRVQDDNVGDLPVAEVMREAITTVEPAATLEEIDSSLDHHSAVLIVEGGQTVGIITEADIAARV
ncbi:CBS domain-containing protein [Halogeometricum borinquense]|uniref:Transcriptional regulator, XRE family n=2 Tax=Halogeometricum borinquense TaxID=60847 RepID=E4NLN4_HALBP|nr:CBS domain-containing protein [Halogeometricum borinquense]ADQ67237.1 transcriptional regulator, XRE family [Halogeometricum borinquense DSM 11551]ELY29571.1 XRE family transcriptional regulator [Halogeometricum borinquense DSM 11551]QIB74529.1 CBS domain-containing protein [Halogeometricum borinquense]QIQ76527.1 CBS domain-containing protein [Halogeometricum borinquense]RYJ13809.1 CBS domain-containing protein [Halogeometricum borinquense]